ADVHFRQITYVRFEREASLAVGTEVSFVEAEVVGEFFERATKQMGVPHDVHVTHFVAIVGGNASLIGNRQPAQVQLCNLFGHQTPARTRARKCLWSHTAPSSPAKGAQAEMRKGASQHPTAGRSFRKSILRVV